MIARRSARSYWRKKEGATAVEFALVSPLIILFMIGSFEVGLAVYENVKINAGAAAAARAFAIHGDDTTEIERAIRSEIGVSLAERVELITSNETIGTGDFKRLDLSFSHQFLVDILGLSDGLTFTATRYAPIVGASTPANSSP